MTAKCKNLVQNVLVKQIGFLLKCGGGRCLPEILQVGSDLVLEVVPPKNVVIRHASHYVSSAEHEKHVK
jgi:hypothetical protein